MGFPPPPAAAVIACVVATLLVAPQASGQVLVRTSPTSLALPPAAPTFGFTTERALNDLPFNQPVAIVSAPNETHRLFVVEKPGRIVVVQNPGSPTPTSSTFLDISGPVIDSGEEGLLALAFHPDFSTNGYFFVWYTLNTSTGAGSGRHDRLSRFRVSAGDPNIADPASEQPLITQRDEAGNHNGGDLHFGPDGYLYLSTGDEGGANDTYGNGQRIDRDFFASILRIDVDLRSQSLAPNSHPAVHAGTYAVPPDNPFVGVTSFNGSSVSAASIRTEIWTIGLRNPWRFSIDSATGLFWIADVGQNQWEEIHRIAGGGLNLGWPYREGLHSGPGGSPPPEAVLVDPVHEYNHSLGNSITGGFIYRGARLSQLFGQYLFADYGSGRIWALPADAAGPITSAQLATDGGIVGFGINPANGDILLADIAEGAIKRLAYNDTTSGTPLPATLSATGAFTSVGDLTPAPGLVAYEPNVSFWSDHATKRRWFALQDTVSTFGFSDTGHWSLPAGAVWVKHFDLETTRGDPSTARRIETRFIVRAEVGIYGMTYRWNDDQTEAVLVPEEGADAEITVVEDGTTRVQTWHFPSRAECLTCHTAHGGHALSFNTRQLNRDHAYSGGTSNQITALSQAGYLSTPVPEPALLPRLAEASDTSAPLELRARSYLDANCSNCHRPGGTALGTWDARARTPLTLAGMLNGPLVDDGGDVENRVIVAGDAGHSRILHRMAASHGATRMPPLATNERDRTGEQLIADWIADLALPRPASRVLNLSGRALVGSGDRVLIPSFVIGGGDPKSVLIRAVGPGLADFQVPGFLPEPTLTLFSGNTSIASNTGWNTAGNAADIASVSSEVGAFPLATGSADSAILATLEPGPYTAHISAAGTTASGVALFEVYDTSASTADTGRLVNTAVRAQVGGDAGVAIPGLVVGDGAAKRVLIRAVGPGLADYDVADFLADPTLTLFAGGEAYLSNSGWTTAENASEIAATAADVGAFPLAVGSADSAMLTLLSPGAYTIHASSAGGGSGVVLVEVYEVQ